MAAVIGVWVSDTLITPHEQYFNGSREIKDTRLTASRCHKTLQLAPCYLAEHTEVKIGYVYHPAIMQLKLF